MKQLYKTDPEYYLRYKKEIFAVIKSGKKWLEEGKVPKDNISYVKQSFASDYLNIIALDYTFSEIDDEDYSYLIKAINAISEGTYSYWKLKDINGNEYPQYILSAYDEMLWLLSLSYLLDVPDEEFLKLVDAIDKDNVKDYLFEFIISAKLKHRLPIEEESYNQSFGVSKVYQKLRDAINQTDKAKAEKLIKEFITKDWYKNHKDAGWYNSHKSKHDSYSGYWSFETAAIVKIMGLNDSSFSDCEFYPKDLLTYKSI